MRWCKHCNCSLGSQEMGVIVDGGVLHERCESPYKRELSDKIASAGHRLLHLPSLRDPPADGGYGDSFR